MTLGRTINILKVLGVAPLLASLFVSCDATIHEYPKSLKAEIVIKADIDHTGPYDYKEIDFDDEMLKKLYEKGELEKEKLKEIR